MHGLMGVISDKTCFKFVFQNLFALEKLREEVNNYF